MSAPIPPRSSHFGRETYSQFSNEGAITLTNKKNELIRTLEFKHPENLTVDGINQNQRISLSHNKHGQNAQNLSFSIGKNTELFKKIQALKTSRSPEDQKKAIKALITKHIAILLDVKEASGPAIKSITARFDPDTESVKLTGNRDTLIADRDYKIKKSSGKIITVSKYLHRLTSAEKAGSIINKTLNPERAKLKIPPPSSPGGSATVGGSIAHAELVLPTASATQFLASRAKLTAFQSSLQTVSDRISSLPNADASTAEAGIAELREDIETLRGVQTDIEKEPLESFSTADQVSLQSLSRRVATDINSYEAKILELLALPPPPLGGLPTGEEAPVTGFGPLVQPSGQVNAGLGQSTVGDSSARSLENHIKVEALKVSLDKTLDDSTPSTGITFSNRDPEIAKLTSGKEAIEALNIALDSVSTDSLSSDDQITHQSLKSQITENLSLFELSELTAPISDTASESIELGISHIELTIDAFNDHQGLNELLPGLDEVRRQAESLDKSHASYSPFIERIDTASALISSKISSITDEVSRLKAHNTHHSGNFRAALALNDFKTAEKHLALFRSNVSDLEASAPPELAGMKTELNRMTAILSLRKKTWESSSSQREPVQAGSTAPAIPTSTRELLDLADANLQIIEAVKSADDYEAAIPSEKEFHAALTVLNRRGNSQARQLNERFYTATKNQLSGFMVTVAEKKLAALKELSTDGLGEQLEATIIPLAKEITGLLGFISGDHGDSLSNRNSQVQDQVRSFLEEKLLPATPPEISENARGIFAPLKEEIQSLTLPATYTSLHEYSSLEAQQVTLQNKLKNMKFILQAKGPAWELDRKVEGFELKTQLGHQFNELETLLNKSNEDRNKYLTKFISNGRINLTVPTRGSKYRLEDFGGGGGLPVPFHFWND